MTIRLPHEGQSNHRKVATTGDVRPMDDVVLKTVSTCGRFVVVEGLHLDRRIFDDLERWAAERGLHIQDAIQIAICALNERRCSQSAVQRAPPASSSSRIVVTATSLDGID